MKLVIEHRSWDPSYAVFYAFEKDELSAMPAGQLDRALAAMLHPEAIFPTEEDAREWCERRAKGARVVAEYPLAESWTA